MSMRHSDALETAQVDRSAFAADVEYYLSQQPRQLPSRYLYDELGSALFEAICRLPWYRIARTEQRLLSLHARLILDRVSPLSALVELGPGSGEKLATLIEAAGIDRRFTLHLVDVSSAALETATRALNGHPDLTVVTHRTTYEEGLSELRRSGRATGRTLALLLGFAVFLVCQLLAKPITARAKLLEHFSGLWTLLLYLSLGLIPLFWKLKEGQP